MGVLAIGLVHLIQQKVNDPYPKSDDNCDQQGAIYQRGAVFLAVFTNSVEQDSRHPTQYHQNYIRYCK